jgi:hypothetical protein
MAKKDDASTTPTLDERATVLLRAVFAPRETFTEKERQRAHNVLLGKMPMERATCVTFSAATWSCALSAAAN